MKKQFLILILLACGMFFGLARNVQAANWYVDNAVANNGSGQSWNTAWKNFSNIQWDSINPGDTLYISGGSSERTYYERLNVGGPDYGKFGTAENPITITIGKETGHNGIVKIRPPEYHGIDLGDCNWIIIDGQSGGDGQRHIDIASPTTAVAIGVDAGGSASNNTIKYLYIHDIGDKTGDSNAAIYITHAGGTTPVGYDISYNLITDSVDCISMGNGDNDTNLYGINAIHHNTLSCLDDGIQPAHGTDIYNNDIARSLNRYTGGGHPDGIQVYGNHVRIYNNYFHDFLTESTGGNSVIYWEPDGGENMDINGHRPGYIQIYNNVFYETGSATLSDGAIVLAISDSRFLSVRDVYVLNNYIEGAYNGGIGFANGTNLNKEDISNIFIENNILYNASASQCAGSECHALNIDIPSTKVGGIPADIGSYNSNASIKVDRNIYYGIGANFINVDGRSYMPGDFNNTFSTNIYTDNPSLDINHKPDAISDPPVDQGISWNSLFNSDKDGTSRPQGSAWDIGAYEYTTTPACTTPGDFTCNGYSISDLQTMISIILGTDSTTSRTQADMTTPPDGLVNISDLQLLIKKVLGIN